MRQTRRGFTLMELTVVVVILALVFSLVLPIVENSTPSYRLSAGIRQIGSFMELAHAESVSSRKPYAVVYDFDNNQHWMLIPVERPVDGDPEKTQWVLDQDDPEARTDVEYLPDNVYFQSIQNSEGQTSQGGTVTIQYNSTSGRGSHIITLGVRTDEDAQLDPWSVKYNTLTRSLTYNNGPLSFYKE